MGPDGRRVAREDRVFVQPHLVRPTIKAFLGVYVHDHSHGKKNTSFFDLCSICFLEIAKNTQTGACSISRVYVSLLEC